MSERESANMKIVINVQILIYLQKKQDYIVLNIKKKI